MIARLALILALGVTLGLGSASGVLGADNSAKSKAPKSNLLGSSENRDQPIDITADTLEVKQSQDIAIFRGNVDALQGDMRLRSDVLIVHYHENKGGPDKGAQTKGGPNKGGPDPSSISKLEAEGNVFISSPTETAQGERGVYDVDRAHIDLFGKVILTQGESVVRGDKLEMNLATGESRVIAQDGHKGRVKGRFVPEKKGTSKNNDEPADSKKN
jgi:lipopolysaccharide export system protein LptA